MSHFSRLKEELDSKQHELQEQQAAIEAQKKVLVAREDEVKAMNVRFTALAALESAVHAAMNTKTSTQDVIKHVVEVAMQSGHMTGGQIVQATLDTAMQVNGRSRNENLDDFFADLIHGNDAIETAIEHAIQKSDDIKDVVGYAVTTAINCGLTREEKKSIIKAVRGVLDDKAVLVEPMKKTGELTENTPHVRLPPVNAFGDNGLRGQAADFKPVPNLKQSYNAGGWQALARDNWGSNGGGGGW